MKNKILIFSGSAGSGKGTVQTILRKNHPEFRLSISMTTRAPRAGEANGREYYFVSREEFLKTLAADGFLEHTEYCGNLYGTPLAPFREMIEKGLAPVLEIETDGAGQVMEKLADYASVFLSPPDYETLERRLRGRGSETEESIQNRMHTAKEEIARSALYQYLVVNPDSHPEEAAEAVYELFEKGETSSPLWIRDRENFLRGFCKN